MIAIEKLKRYKSSGIDKIPAELIKARGMSVSFETHKLINSILKKELFEPWKESITRGEENRLSNYKGISLLSITSTYKILSNILPSKLTPYAGEVIGDQQFEFRLNRSSTNRIFLIREILGRPRGQNEAVHLLLIDFKRTYDPVRRDVLYNILIEFGIPLKLARLIKMCLNETDSRVRVGIHFSDMFPI